MPTTIYDSSLITQRLRDKLISRQVYTANKLGNSIITPQSGYASYYSAEVSNGNITYYRKEGQCTNINSSCNCIQHNSYHNLSLNNNHQNNLLLNTNLPINIQPNNDPEYLITINVPSNALTVEIQLNGSGHIYWGDGFVEEFNTSDMDQIFTHIYSSDGTYNIRIATFITKLILSNTPESGGTFFPDVRSLTLINPEGLTTLLVSSNNLESINGLNNCINLEFLAIGNNTCNINDINSLSNIHTLILSDRPTLTSFDASYFPQLKIIYLDNSPVVSISNLPNTIEIINAENTAIKIASKVYNKGYNHDGFSSSSSSLD